MQGLPLRPFGPASLTRGAKRNGANLRNPWLPQMFTAAPVTPWLPQILSDTPVILLAPPMGELAAKLTERAVTLGSLR